MLRWMKIFTRWIGAIAFSLFKEKEHVRNRRSNQLDETSLAVSAYGKFVRRWIVAAHDLLIRNVKQQSQSVCVFKISESLFLLETHLLGIQFRIIVHLSLSLSFLLIRNLHFVTHNVM